MEIDDDAERDDEREERVELGFKKKQAPQLRLTTALREAQLLSFKAFASHQRWGKKN